MSKMECAICFDDLPEGVGIHCHMRCETVYCTSCFERYIDICVSEQTMPRCTCKGEYLYPLVVKEDEENKTLKAQMESLIIEMLANGTIADSIEKRNAVQAQLKKSFFDYIDEFPESVKTCIKLCYPKIHKDIAKRLLKDRNDDRLKAMYRCKVGACKGKVMHDLVENTLLCSQCALSYCHDCSEPISSSDHICKKEDLEAVKLISQAVPCPKCLTPIHRSEGCKYMTCTVCGTDFDYSTGKRCHTGNNHNESIAATVRLETALSEELAALITPEQRKSLQRIELTVKQIKPCTTFEEDLAKYIVSKSTTRRRKLLHNYYRRLITGYIRQTASQELYRFEELVRSKKASEANLNTLEEVFAYYTNFRTLWA